MTPQREREILDAYKRHQSIHNAAYVACASKTTVRRIAKEAGILRSQARPWAPLPNLDTLFAMVKKHGTHVQVAKILGCHVNTLRNRMYGRRGR